MKIPVMDFRGNKFVNQDGTLTDVAQGFFDALSNALIKGIGDEGLVAPSHTTSEIKVIQDNVITSVTNNKTFTCNFGTFIYNSSTNKVNVSLNTTLTPGPLFGVPVFKEVLTT